MSCDNIFIDGCKSINEIRLVIIEKVGANDVERILDELKKIKHKRCRVWIKNHNMDNNFLGANDVERILDELKKIKDKKCRVWIKNHNMKNNFLSVKLLLVIHLVCVMLMVVTIILLMLNK